VTNISEGRYQLVINTTSDEKAILDSYSLRRTALEKKIAYCTLLTMARAFLKAIEVVQARTLALSPLKPTLPASSGNGRNQGYAHARLS
jgi:carbamoyl-phosphate synthase large subunit